MSASEQRSGGAVAAKPSRTGWSQSLAEAIRSRADLLAELGLPPETDGRNAAHDQSAETEFPVLVPRSFLARMEPGNRADPLLRQVLPVEAENADVPGFGIDAVGDADSKRAPGLIHKYAGRALLIAAGACAVHCRYCFRRHYPYGDDPRRLDDWQPALQEIAADESIHEVILSGGDPLMLTDRRLGDLIELISEIPHVRRLRIHSRLPIVLPNRVADRLLSLLKASNSRLQPWFVIHANHPNEIAADCVDAIKALVDTGIPVLNQAVLLRGVNDSADSLVELCERLINLGVQPYYLHLLDRVAGTAHFEVPETEAVELMASIRQRLPGYAMPTLVREIPGEAAKTVIRA